LKATTPAATTDEVSTEQLGALRNGSLTKQERQRVLELLDSSESCYQEWLALNRYLDDEAADESTVSRPWYANYPAWSIGTAAAGALLVLIFVLGQPPSLERMLEQSYAEAISKGIVSPTVTLPELFTAPRPGYSLATNATDRLPRRALGAGLWAGSATLRGDADVPYPDLLLPPGRAEAHIGQAPWQGTEWAGHAALGRWLVLVAAACTQPASNHQSFWRNQATIANLLATRIANEDETALTAPLLKQLREIVAPIAQLAADVAPERSCAEVERSAERLAAFAHPINR